MLWKKYDSTALEGILKEVRGQRASLGERLIIQQMQHGIRATQHSDTKQDLDRLGILQQRFELYKDLHGIIRQAAEAADRVGWTDGLMKATADAMNAVVAAAQAAGNPAAEGLVFEPR